MDKPIAIHTNEEAKLYFYGLKRLHSEKYKPSKNENICRLCHLNFFNIFTLSSDKITIDFNNIDVIINNVKHYINNIFKGAKMNVNKIPEWVLAMEQEDITFIKKFMLQSGSLKEIAKLYDVSYPTVRLRLDRIIQKIEINDKKEQEPFQTFIKGLAVDSKIDLETAKIIIEKYREEKGEK